MLFNVNCGKYLYFFLPALNELNVTLINDCLREFNWVVISTCNML